MQHENSATGDKHRMESVQDKKNGNMERVQHEKVQYKRVNYGKSAQN